MSLQTIRVLVTDLVILAALGVGGWFLGAELLADEAGPATPITVASEAPGATTTDSSLVVPLSGLSPFGHPNGLVGRQVLVGRVTEVGEDFFIAETASGPATFRFDDDSTFLLRLARGSRADIIPGVSVAILGDETAEGSIEARSILVLPADVRPSVTGPSPLDFATGPPDTDGDGVSDPDEVEAGTDPLTADSDERDDADPSGDAEGDSSDDAADEG